MITIVRPFRITFTSEAAEVFQVVSDTPYMVFAVDQRESRSPTSDRLTNYYLVATNYAAPVWVEELFIKSILPEG